MATRNGIHVYIRSTLLLPQCGKHWVAIPDEGVPAEIAGVLAKYSGEVYDGYRGSTLDVTATTWEAVVEAARAEMFRAAKEAAELAQLKQRQAEEQARKQEERAELTGRWRLLATKYMAGGDVVVTKCGASWIALDGIDSDRTNITGTPYFLDVIREHDRRMKERIAKEQAEAEAAAKAINAARLEWLRLHGSPDQVERFEADVLPMDEFEETIKKFCLPCAIESGDGQSDAIEYIPHDASDIDHESDCTADGDSRVSFVTEDANGAQLTSGQWKRLKTVRSAFKGTPGATVDIRRSKAILRDCSCTQPEWLKARVRVIPPGLDIEVQRQYALGE